MPNMKEDTVYAYAFFATSSVLRPRHRLVQFLATQVHAMLFIPVCLGTIEDERDVSKWFTSGNFRSYYDVDVRSDLDSDRFFSALHEWKRKLQDEDSVFDRFFLFIMSHGDKVYVMLSVYDPVSPPSLLLPETRSCLSVILKRTIFVCSCYLCLSGKRL